MIDQSGIPGDPDYDPHWDPNVHEPEVPVPGLDTTVPIVEPGGNADGHIDYPDVEAPVSPVQQQKNLLGAMYQTNIWIDGKLTYQPSCPNLQTDDPNASVEAHRDQVRALLFFIFWNRRARPSVVMQTRDITRDVWIDLSADKPPVITDWDGMVTVDVRVNAGWGDKL